MVQQHGYPDEDRGPRLAAAYIAGCAISFVFVAMRLTARYSIAGVGIDDWCMLASWIVFIPLTVLVSMFSLTGGTRHLAYLSNDQARTNYILELNWIAQPFAILCLGLSKIAVGFLIIRLLNRSSVWRRWSLYFFSALTAINTILMIIFTFVQCKNPAALWDSEIKKTTECWDPKIQSSFSIYGASMHAVVDFFLALVPVTLVWRLKTDLRKRVALCALLGCGCLTGISAAIKTTKLNGLNARSDFTWETFSLFLWTGIEIILSIVCGSIPALKPIYGLCMGRRPSTHPSGQRYTHGTPKSDKKYRPQGAYVRQNDDVALALAPNTTASSTVVIGGPAAEDFEMGYEVKEQIVRSASGRRL
ncbi:uncharacterized protein EI97DRAFT_373146 [Westerdykella ornata]|uniref:Rhodopsin domain-containing protein n=1 Tax=Westerdykella ornata TaxID=318751 RepID=A0A6A6JQ23_WESOR|nr:uncharacterized protein EI97DRAFT_373146 [Westerdykella ornata]KAF2278355.1 hypothetical protein EI97DRAFT_373146 [Westerdykella ornata]